MTRRNPAEGAHTRTHERSLSDEDYFDQNPNAARLREHARRLLAEPGATKEGVQEALTNDFGADTETLRHIFRMREQEPQLQQQAQIGDGESERNPIRENEIRAAALKLSEIREKGNKGTQFLRELKKQNFSAEEIAQIDAAGGEPAKTRSRESRKATDTAPSEQDVQKENADALQQNVIWIEQQRDKGVADADIISTLRDNDWAENDILEALTAANLKTVTPDSNSKVPDVAAAADNGESASAESSRLSNAPNNFVSFKGSAEQESRPQAKEADSTVLHEAMLGAADEMERRELEGQRMKDIFLHILKYQDMGVPSKDILANLKERGLTAGQIANLQIQAGRVQEKRKAGLKMRQTRQSTILSEEKKAARELGKSLGQIETNPDAVHQDTDEAPLKLGREMPRNVVADDGPLIQVETKPQEISPTETAAHAETPPEKHPYVADDVTEEEQTPTEAPVGTPISEADAGIDTSAAVNPFTVNADAQNDYDVLKADIHASEERRQAASEGASASENNEIPIEQFDDAFNRLYPPIPGSLTTSAPDDIFDRFYDLRERYQGSLGDDKASIASELLSLLSEPVSRSGPDGGAEASAPDRYHIYSDDELRTVDEDTPLGWRTKLKQIIAEKIGDVKEGVRNTAESASERFEKAAGYLSERGNKLRDSIADRLPKSREALKQSKERAAALGAYLATRGASLSAQAKVLGKGTGENLMKTGEWYRKLPLKYKIGLSAALLGTTVLTGGASTLVTLVTTSAMLGQRALGSLGMYTLIEGALEKKFVTAESKGRFVRSKWDTYAKHGLASLSALLVFSGLPGSALKEGLEGLSNHSGEWLASVRGYLSNVADMQEGTKTPSPAPSNMPPGPAPAGEGTSAPTAPASAPGETAPIAAPAEVQPVPSQDVAVAGADTTASQTHEAAPVPGAEPAIPPEAMQIDIAASKGHGYEYMTKRLWEQLQEKHVSLPSGANPDSALAKLLAADKDSIDKVVHQLAQENKFFQADGANVLITPDSHIGFDSEGNILIRGSNMAEGGSWFASSDADVTPAYHPEAATAGVHGSSEGIIEKTIEVPVVHDVPFAHPDAPIMDADASHAASAGAEANTASADTLPPVEDHDFIINARGVTVPLAEAHIYSDGKELVIYGGVTKDQAPALLKYLSAHPQETVFSGDEAGKYRVPWKLVEGKLVSGEPVKTTGILGIFQRFATPPGPEEFTKVVQ